MKFIGFTFLLAVSFCTNCQEKKDVLSFAGTLDFLGYKEGNAILIDDRNSIFELSTYNDVLHISKISDSTSLKEKWPIYFNDDVEVYGDDQKVILFHKQHRFDIQIDKKHIGSSFRPIIAEHKNFIFCALNSSNNLNEEFTNDNIRVIDLDNVGDSARILPLKATKIQIVKEWLYYSESILNDDGTITYSNIYRVKLWNWESPELISTRNSAETWFVDYENPDRIFFRKYINKEYRNIILDISIKKFAELHDNDSERISHSDHCFFAPKILKVFFLKRAVSENEITRLIPFPSIPDYFPYTFTN